MARPGRLELPTLCLEGRRSIQLSYGRYVNSKRFPVSTTILSVPLPPFCNKKCQNCAGTVHKLPDSCTAVVTSMVISFAWRFIFSSASLCIRNFICEYFLNTFESL